MLDAVTGAFSFTGKAITGQLLAEGREVVTFVRRPAPPEADPRIRSAPFTFDDPAALTAAFSGVDTFYNTYWIRFERGEMTFGEVIRRTRLLLTAARQAGVRRLVHVSVVNAASSAPTRYFTAKALLDDVVRASGLSHAIVRPTLTFGPGDILVNNLCWVLRRVPAFAIPADGEYRLQPVHVDDAARIAIAAGSRDPRPGRRRSGSRHPHLQPVRAAAGRRRRQQGAAVPRAATGVLPRRHGSWVCWCATSCSPGTR